VDVEEQTPETASIAMSTAGSNSKLLEGKLLRGNDRTILDVSATLAGSLDRPASVKCKMATSSPSRPLFPRLKDLQNSLRRSWRGSSGLQDDVLATKAPVRHEDRQRDRQSEARAARRYQRRAGVAAVLLAAVRPRAPGL